MGRQIAVKLTEIDLHSIKVLASSGFATRVSSGFGTEAGGYLTHYRIERLKVLGMAEDANDSLFGVPSQTAHLTKEGQERAVQLTEESS